MASKRGAIDSYFLKQSATSSATLAALQTGSNVKRARQEDPTQELEELPASGEGPSLQQETDERECADHSSAASTHGLPETPNHVDPSLVPKQSKKSRTLSFQQSWYTDFPWLHWDATLQKFLCFWCAKAHERKLDRLTKCSEPEFTTTGYSGNWSHAKENFRKHQSSRSHLTSVSHLSIKESPIEAQLSESAKTEQASNLEALKRIVSCIRYCATQGIALRGHKNADGHFAALLNLIRMDVPALDRFLQRKKKDMFTSAEIQNEIIRIMAHEVQRLLISQITSSPSGIFSIMVDETTDISKVEQVSVCVRFVDPDLNPKEVFLGLHETSSTTGEHLTAIILSVLKQLGLSLPKLRGQCYDGAANMSGKYKGVRSRVLAENNKAIFVHCVNHCLNLVLQDTAKAVPFIRETMQVCHEVGAVISESASRVSAFKDCLSSEGFADASVPRGLCTTRWTVRTKALSRLIRQYHGTQAALEEIASSLTHTHEGAAKCAGLATQMQKSATLLGLLVCESVFGKAEALAAALQGPNMTVANAKSSAATLLRYFETLRSEASFETIWKKMEEMASDLSLDPCPVPRAKRLPKRLEFSDNPAPAHTSSTASEHYRQLYFQFLDTVTTRITDRFEQPSLDTLILLERVLLEKDVSHLPAQYSDEVDAARLAHEFGLLPEKFKSLQQATSHFQQMETGKRNIFQETEKLLRLLLVVPPTSATPERSFSCLRRLKTWLRSSTSQERLTHLAVLHTHRELAMEIDLRTICKQFIFKENRRSIFGDI